MVSDDIVTRLRSWCDDGNCKYNNTSATCSNKEAEDPFLREICDNCEAAKKIELLQTELDLSTGITKTLTDLLNKLENQIEQLQNQVKLSHAILSSESFGWFWLGSEHEDLYRQELGPYIQKYWLIYGSAFKPGTGTDDTNAGEHILIGGQKLRGVHSPHQCLNQYCTIHNFSDHHMVQWEQNWRNDINLMERICPHGVGHPDPDEINPNRSHGCDGCCVPPEERKL